MLDGGGADTFLGESEIPSFTSLQKKTHRFKLFKNLKSKN